MNGYWILLKTLKKSSMKIIEWVTLTDFPIFNQPLCFLSLLVMKYHILNGGVGTYLLIHKVLSFVLVLAFNLPYFTFSSFCVFSENVFSFFWKWKWKYPILCNPMDCIVHGILQARMLKWVAFPFSRASFQPRDWTQVSHITGRFFTSWATRDHNKLWTILKEMGMRPPDLPPEKPVCRSRSSS